MRDIDSSSSEATETTSLKSRRASLESVVIPVTIPRTSSRDSMTATAFNESIEAPRSADSSVTLLHENETCLSDASGASSVTEVTPSVIPKEEQPLLDSLGSPYVIREAGQGRSSPDIYPSPSKSSISLDEPMDSDIFVRDVQPDAAGARNLLRQNEYTQNVLKSEELIVSVTDAALQNYPVPLEIAPTFEISEDLSPTTIPTTIPGKTLIIHWDERVLRYGSLRTKFAKCKLQSIWRSEMICGGPQNMRDGGAEWRVVLQMSTLTTWAVTLCISQSLHDSGIIDRLQRHFGAYRNLDVRCGSQVMNISAGDRPGVGQLPISYDLARCRNSLSSIMIPSELRNEIFKSLNMATHDEWWLKICCRMEQAFPAPQTHLPSLSNEDCYALRSLLLVANVSGCYLGQVKLTGRLLDMLTGNDDNLHALEYYDPTTGNLLATHLNSRRSYRYPAIKAIRPEMLRPTFLSTDSPINVDDALTREELEALRLAELARLDQLSGYYQSALRGQNAATKGSPTRQRLNPANLVGDERLQFENAESSKFLRKFRFPHILEPGIQSILGVSFGRARAMMDTIERGTAHQILALHTNNLKLAMLDILGLDRSLWHRWSICAAAVVPLYLSVTGQPCLILGDAGATLTAVTDTLTFSPVLMPGCRVDFAHEMLLQSDRLNDMRLGISSMNLDLVRRRVIMIRHGENESVNDEDSGLTERGRMQMEATARWLAQSMSFEEGLFGRVTTWSAAGLATQSRNLEKSVAESLELFRNSFLAHAPLYMSETAFPEDAGLLMPENLFRASFDCGNDLDIVVADEYRALQYFGACFGIAATKLANMRVPHAAFIAVNINAIDQFAWCPTFGMIAHVPPPLLASVP